MIKPDTYVMVVLVIAILNGLATMILGAAGAEKKPHYDALDALFGALTVIVAVLMLMA